MSDATVETPSAWGERDSPQPVGEQAEVLAALACGPVPHRLLVVAAHPGDETLGAGDLISRTRDVAVVHVAGELPREADPPSSNGPPGLHPPRMGRAEVLGALGILGLGAERCRSLGYPDREPATALPLISRALARILAERFEVVVTHGYDGLDPDHDATAFAVHAAAELRRRHGAPAPVIVEMPVRHDPNAPPNLGLPSGSPGQIVVSLTASQRDRKARMLSSFHLPPEWIASRIDRELFRLAPRHDFSRPPQAGRAPGRVMGWGLGGSEFCTLAAAAASELGIERSSPPGPR